MPKPRFLRMPDDERAALLDAALRTFATSGFHDASLNALLRSLEMSKGAFYHAFEDKADLYAAVVTHVASAVPAFTPLGDVDTPDAFWALVAGNTMSMYSFIGADPDREAFARDIARVYASGQLPPAVQSIFSRLDDIVLDYVRAGQRAGAVRTDVPEQLVAQMLVAAGAALDVWVARHLPDMEQATALLPPVLEMMQRMVAPTAPTP